MLRSGVMPTDSPLMAWGVFLGILLLAVGVIALDMAFPRKRLDAISAVYFGLIVGLFLAYVGGLALTPLFPAKPGTFADQVRASVQLILAAIASYICISLLLQTRNDFRSSIPTWSFLRKSKAAALRARHERGGSTAAIADIVETRSSTANW